MLRRRQEMISTPKFAAFLTICFVSVSWGIAQDPSTQQFSILERTDLPKEQTLRQEQTAPLARVAQLPNALPQVGSTRRAQPSIQPQSLTNSTSIKPARFELGLTGPDLVKAGELQTFKIQIENQWPSHSHPLELRLGIPPGFQFADSNIQAQIDTKQNLVSWTIDSIPASQSLEIFFRANPIGKGPQLHQLNLIQDGRIVTAKQFETFVLTQQSVVGQSPAQRISQDRRAIAREAMPGNNTPRPIFQR